MKKEQQVYQQIMMQWSASHFSAYKNRSAGERAADVPVAEAFDLINP